MRQSVLSAKAHAEAVAASDNADVELYYQFMDEERSLVPRASYLSVAGRSPGAGGSLGASSQGVVHRVRPSFVEEPDDEGFFFLVYLFSFVHVLLGHGQMVRFRPPSGGASSATPRLGGAGGASSFGGASSSNEGKSVDAAADFLRALDVVAFGSQRSGPSTERITNGKGPCKRKAGEVEDLTVAAGPRKLGKSAVIQGEQESWNEFRKKMKKSGLSQEEMAEAYHQQKNGKYTMLKFTAFKFD